MATLEEYVRSVLQEAQQACESLQSISDRPGDLEQVRRQWLRLRALFRSISSRVEASGAADREMAEIARMCAKYVAEYDFDGEMRAMAGLYSDDPSRIRNMRLKVLESLREGGLSRAIMSQAGGP